MQNIITVSCCLMPTQQMFRQYPGENKSIFNEMMMRSS